MQEEREAGDGGAEGAEAHHRFGDGGRDAAEHGGGQTALLHGRDPGGEKIQGPVPVHPFPYAGAVHQPPAEGRCER